jgi:hypothetical protein
VLPNAYAATEPQSPPLECTGVTSSTTAATSPAIASGSAHLKGRVIGERNIGREYGRRA